MRSSSRVLVPLLALALASACRNEIWLSEDGGDGALDAGLDAHVVPLPDADVLDALDAHDAFDALDALDANDAAHTAGRACERTPVAVVEVNDADPLESPTLATSGRLTTLRYGVLVPPAANVALTDDTRLLVLDAEASLLRERRIRLDDASGDATSAATLHALSPLTSDEGFVLLAPREIRRLDAEGDDTAPPTVLTTPPSPAWQRLAGWIDADRFVFVSDTADLRLAVFDRTTGTVTTTTISATGAGSVHLDPSGVTIASAGPTSEVVIYDPDLSGTETLRTIWEDGSVLGERLLGASLMGGERTWVVRTAAEFRSNVQSYRVMPPDAPVGGASMVLLAPMTATREGAFVAIQSLNPALVIYAFDTDTFSMVASDFEGTPLVEDERDGTNVSIVFFEPASGGTRALTLACGRR